MTWQPPALDWSGRDGVRHWGGGELRPCRTCGQPAFLLDNDGRPQHKTCAERELAVTEHNPDAPERPYLQARPLRDSQPTK
jgi:hypothetical protein